MENVANATPEKTQCAADRSLPLHFLQATKRNGFLKSLIIFPVRKIF